MYVPSMIYPVVIVCIVEKTYVLSIDHLLKYEVKLSIIFIFNFFFHKEKPTQEELSWMGKGKHIISSKE